MPKAKCLLAGALLVAGLTVVPAAEAQMGLPAVPPFDSPPMSCTLTPGPEDTIVIQAGPTSTSFPEPVTCPTGVPGTCLRWPYRFIYTNLNPLNAEPSILFISFDTDSTVWAAGPGFLTAEPPQPDISGIATGGAAERLLRFNAKAPGVCANTNGTVTCNVSLVTGTAITGTLTGGIRFNDLKKSCMIAGAGDPIAVAGLSEPKKETTTTLECTIEWTRSGDGCFLSAVVVAGDCSIETGVQTNPVTNQATCPSELNFPGSCKTCRWNSFLKNYTCVTRTDINC